MQALVLAGGLGTRLRLGDDALPKSLVPLCGSPVLDHILGWLAVEGVDDVVLCTSHRHESIEKAMGDGKRFGLRIRYSVEHIPLGTAGAARLAVGLLEERFLVVYGDVIADVGIAELVRAHRASGALATLVVHPNNHVFDSDRVVADAAGKIRSLVRKEDHAGAEAGALCSAALYVCERSLLESIPDDGVPRDFARDVFRALATQGAALFAYRTAEYLQDMGTVQRREQVESDLRRGIPRSMRRSALRPAVLLDRDGVLVEDLPYIRTPDQLRLIPGVAGALRRLNEERIIVACVTNQPVVARGEVSEEGLNTIHTTMEGMLGQQGVWLDQIFVCPHHTNAGFPGERPELKLACTCRKPLPGLVRQAEAALGIDRRGSILVGDRTTDLVCARAAGVLGIGVLTGAACKDRKHALSTETALVPGMQEAVALLLDTAPSWDRWLSEVLSARVVLIGGPSRSGKTLATNALRLRLEAQGVHVLHVSLDRFILPASERSAASTAAARDRLVEAGQALSRLLDGEAALFPNYDPQTRGRAPSALLQRSPGTVLLVDGVLALAVDVPGALRVTLNAPEELLLARRQSFYSWKGLEGPDLRAALDSRAEEQWSVASAANAASLRLTFDSSQRLVPAP